MRQLNILIAIVLTAFSCGRNIIVYNDSNNPIKGEIVEVDLYDIFQNGERNFVLYDKDGNVISSQITYEDRVIFRADVPAMGKSIYRIEKIEEAEEDNVWTSDSIKTVEPIVSVVVNGEPLFSAGKDKSEILDNGPLRYTSATLHFPIPIDTTWVKPRSLTSIDSGNGLSKKVWFEDLKGEHEIMIAIPANGYETISVSKDSISFGNGNTTVFLSIPVHKVGYREVLGKVCLAGYCTLEGPEPLEVKIDKSGDSPLDIEICGNER